MRRDLFIGRIRAALGGADAVARPVIDPSLVQTQTEMSDPVERFKAAAAAVGVEVVVCSAEGKVACVAAIVADDAAGTCVTGVTHAIAETGSLVLHAGTAEGAGVERLDSLAPRTHVAVVLTAQIVPSLWDYLSTASSSEPASRIIVTGPSKTADIEGVLITGVHGPGRVVVVLVATQP
jgi:L-lactate utilization protein LutB